MPLKNKRLVAISAILLVSFIGACGTLSNVSLPVSTQLAYPALMASPAEYNTEKYAYLDENGFKDPMTDPLSTFSVDVDTASYSNVRRMLRENTLPEPGAVRIEELINYFHYEYPVPQGDAPVAVYREVSSCPWNSAHQLLQIGLQAKKIDMEGSLPSNLVFLIDVSGSMSDDLSLVKASLKMLVAQLRSDDRVAIVVYAGEAGTVLAPTRGDNKQAIETALDQLESGGSTAGGAGIEQAYRLAEENFIKGGNNRIILATDGDFNVGPSSEDALVRLIESKRDRGIFLTVLGFGQGNYNDVTAEALADHGNGTYAYIDNLLEAKKVLISEIGGTLLTVAKDVKLQVEFNPARVAQYRLIGYENRLLSSEDFDNDKKDAGDMGAGHSVTALYEIVPRDPDAPFTSTLKYQHNDLSNVATTSKEVAQVAYRYKDPNEDQSRMLSFVVDDPSVLFDNASENIRFAASVAAWGMILRHSEFKGSADLHWVAQTARSAKGADPDGDRAEFVRMVDLSEILEKKGI